MKSGDEDVANMEDGHSVREEELHGQTRTRKGWRCLGNGKPTWLEKTKPALSTIPFSFSQTG